MTKPVTTKQQWDQYRSNTKRLADIQQASIGLLKEKVKELLEFPGTASIEVRLRVIADIVENVKTNVIEWNTLQDIIPQYVEEPPAPYVPGGYPAGSPQTPVTPFPGQPYVETPSVYNQGRGQGLDQGQRQGTEYDRVGNTNAPLTGPGQAQGVNPPPIGGATPVVPSGLKTPITPTTPLKR